jgi:hypothetical protein
MSHLVQIVLHNLQLIDILFRNVDCYEIKCDMLYHLNSFLELREEAIVLLKRGIQAYDELMLYAYSFNGNNAILVL